MAHFAELDENNVVLRVIVVSDANTSDINGVESEEIGIGYCKKILGSNTRWKQTSYNNNIRFRYAAIGFIYNEQLDAFIREKPYPSWILNETIADWEAPIPMPNDGNHYIWNESTQSWDLGS